MSNCHFVKILSVETISVEIIYMSATTRLARRPIPVTNTGCTPSEPLQTKGSPQTKRSGFVDEEAILAETITDPLHAGCQTGSHSHIRFVWRQTIPRSVQGVWCQPFTRSLWRSAKAVRFRLPSNSDTHKGTRQTLSDTH